MSICALKVGFALFSLVSLGAIAGCAAQTGDTENDAARVGRQASAIQGGTTDTSEAHNFAVGITNRQGSVCSGTLIAPNLVLTARHCHPSLRGRRRHVRERLPGERAGERDLGDDRVEHLPGDVVLRRGRDPHARVDGLLR
jgi:hypothetical protein